MKRGMEMTTAKTKARQMGMTKLLEGVESARRASTTPRGGNAIQTRSHAPQTNPKGMATGHDWRIGADPSNVILYRRVRSKGGIKERWVIEGYYSTVGNALVALVRAGVRETELRDLQSVQDKIARLEHDILKMAAGK
jgi:hypothetical protein